MCKDWYSPVCAGTKIRECSIVINCSFRQYVTCDSSCMTCVSLCIGGITANCPPFKQIVEPPLLISHLNSLPSSALTSRFFDLCSHLVLSLSLSSAEPKPWRRDWASIEFPWQQIFIHTSPIMFPWRFSRESWIWSGLTLIMSPLIFQSTWNNAVSADLQLHQALDLYHSQFQAGRSVWEILSCCKQV